MGTNEATKLSGRVKESIEQARGRLMDLQAEALKVVQELVEKGKASSKDVTELLQKVGTPDLVDREYLKQLTGKARGVRREIVDGFEDLRHRVIALAGVATREEVDEIARDLNRLSKKIDRAVGGAKKPAKRRA